MQWKLGKGKSFRYSLLFLGALTLPLVTSSIVLFSQQNQPKYWVFDNEKFNNRDSIYQYVNNDTDFDSFTAKTKNYHIDDQIFSNFLDANSYLNNKFEINSVLTNHNPSNYEIGAMGELSNEILINPFSKPIKVYEGKDNIAYRDRNEALSTYKNYDKVYIDDEGREHASFQDIYNFLKDKKIKEIENNPKKVVYSNGALMQTEDEVKTWLRKNIKRGFTYKGRNFSDYNYSQYLDFFQNLDEDLINQNVISILNADKSSYWLDLNHAEIDNLGTFAGPKYVETEIKIPQPVINHNFVEIESYTPGFIQGIIGSILVSTVATTNYSNEVINKEHFNWKNGYFSNKTENKIGGIFSSYLGYLKDNEIISDLLYNQLEKLMLDLKNNTSSFFNFLKDSTIGLDTINDFDFTDLHKMMIAIKRILATIKIYSEFSSDEIANLENLFKQLVIEVSTNGLSSNPKENQRIDAFDLKKNLQGFSIYELSDFILNPANFYKSGENYESMINITKKIDSVITEIWNAFSLVGKTIKIKENIQKYTDAINPNKNKKMNTQDLSKKKDSVVLSIEKTIDENIIDVNNHLGLSSYGDSAKPINQIAPGISSLIKIISALFEINQMLNFVSFKTYEYKIDDYQSIYYFIQVPKIPILNIEAPVSQPTINVTKLTDSIVKYMLPDEQAKKESKVYEFQGKYYLNKANAIEALKGAIYLNPELFIPTTEILTSVLEIDDHYALPDYLTKVRKNSDDEGLTPAEYWEELNKEINKYVDLLFKQYYSAKGKEFYLDGLGNYFDNKLEAINSLKNKLNNPEELEKLAQYVYTTRTNQRVIRETEAELNMFVDENEIIDEKTVNSDDLIKTGIYTELEEFTSNYFEINELNYFGDKKYFMTYQNAWDYLLTNLKRANLYKEVEYTFYSETNFVYKNNQFKDRATFNSWIEANIETIY